MHPERDLLVASLPIHAEELSIRQLTRLDMDLLSKWPPYPWPHEVFRFSFSGYAADELDSAYEARIHEADRITLVVDASKESAIGYVALVQVDWVKRISENMCFRIHPHFCDQGIGSRIVSVVRDWWFGHGMSTLRLDVAATNHRAVRCYLNAGFEKTGEFWREAPDLGGKDLSEDKYRFLGNDVDCSAEVPQVRFYWMEATIGQQFSAADG